MLFIEFIVEFFFFWWCWVGCVCVLSVIYWINIRIIAFTIVVHRLYCRRDSARETSSHISGSESSRELLELLNVRMSCRTCCNEKVFHLEPNQFISLWFFVANCCRYRKFYLTYPCEHDSDLSYGDATWRPYRKIHT